MMFFRKASAFIQKDLIEALSYKIAFLLNFFSIFLSVMVFYFLSKLIGNSAIPYLQPYGGDYFSFVLIGIAFANYLQVALHSYSESIRNSQMMGTLEAILVTQTEIPTIIISSSLYSFLWTSFQVIVYLLLGVLLFQLNIRNANIAGALIILVLTIIAFSGLGIISASFIMVLKKGDPIASLFASISWLLGGVFYPISVLPEWLQKISSLIPLTYSLEGMRYALLKGYSIRALSSYIIGLTLFSLLIIPLSIISFKFAVNKAKKEGSLTHY